MNSTQQTLINNLRMELAFVLEKHSVLGWIFCPYMIKTSTNGQFTLTFHRVTLQTINDYDRQLNPIEEQIFKTIEDYSDEAIVRRFSRSKMSVKDFYAKLDAETITRSIRPSVEKRLVRCIDLFIKGNIHPHFKAKKESPILDKSIDIINQPADAVFNFIRSDEGIKYFLTLKDRNDELTLCNQQAAVVSLQPCWLFLQNKLYLMNDQVDGKKLIPFFDKEYILVPKRSEESYFQKFILPAVTNFHVKASGFDILENNPEPFTFIKLENSLQGNPQFVLFFRYGEKSVLLHEKINCFVSLQKDEDNYTFRKQGRNFALETQRKELLISLGLLNNEGSTFILPRENKLLVNPGNEQNEAEMGSLVNWLNKNNQILQENRIEVVQDFFKDKYFIGNMNIDLQVQNQADWFDIYGTVSFDDLLIPFINLRKHILNHIREYVLPNGEIAMIPEEWFARYYDIMQFSTTNGERAKLKKHHYGLIYPFLEEEEKKNDFVEFMFFSDKTKLSQPEIPEDLHASLRPYQTEGYTWLSYLQDLDLGGCLADDMGLGKTLQTITLLTASKHKKSPKIQQKEAVPLMPSLFSDEAAGLSKPDKTSLIVMPLSLICNWENEVVKFAPHLKLFKHIGASRIQEAGNFGYYDLVLTTYGIVRNDLELLKKFDFYYLILDESQAIKNPDSKIYHAIKELQARHRLVLSGTPIENSLSDLWAQMSFLNPGLLGNLKFFRNEFQVPIEKDKDENKQEKLKKLIAPFILRRTKALVEKDLPPLTEKVYYCEMSDEQKSLYETKKSEIRNSLLENLEETIDNKTRFLVLKGLMQLRLLANHPALTDKQSLSASGKFEEVIRNIENLILENHKVLIFSQFVKHLNLFRDYFEQQNWRYSYLTGDTNGNNRQAIIDSFQRDPDNHLFLISLKAGGYGLNITAADYVFILDPWWNPASENQAISRAYRIGQKNKVMAYKFITKDSIEEKILRLQEKKSNLAEAFVSVNNPLHLFTSDELIGLFE